MLNVVWDQDYFAHRLEYRIPGAMGFHGWWPPERCLLEGLALFFDYMVNALRVRQHILIHYDGKYKSYRLICHWVNNQIMHKQVDLLIPDLENIYSDFAKLTAAALEQWDN
jgi:hypothetical protein